MPDARPSPADTSADRSAKPTLSPLQLVGSALAAATSAVVASFFGVAGTVIGAALASVITTVSATVYSASLRKTNERLRGLSGRFAGGHSAAPPRTQVLPRRPATRDLPAGVDPRRAPARSRRVYVRLAAGAAAVFVAAMAIVTGIELIGQKPVSAMVTRSSSSGTTVGDLTDAGSHKAPGSSTPAPGSSTPTTAPATPSATPSATSSGTPSATSSARSTSAAQTSSATATPTPTTSSSAAPTTAAQDSSTPTP